MNGPSSSNFQFGDNDMRKEKEALKKHLDESLARAKERDAWKRGTLTQEIALNKNGMTLNGQPLPIKTVLRPRDAKKITPASYTSSVPAPKAPPTVARTEVDHEELVRDADGKWTQQGLL